MFFEFKRRSLGKQMPWISRSWLYIGWSSIQIFVLFQIIECRRKWRTCEWVWQGQLQDQTLPDAGAAFLPITSANDMREDCNSIILVKIGKKDQGHCIKSSTHRGWEMACVTAWIQAGWQRANVNERWIKIPNVEKIGYDFRLKRVPTIQV